MHTYIRLLCFAVTIKVTGYINMIEIDKKCLETATFTVLLSLRPYTVRFD